MTMWNMNPRVVGIDPSLTATGVATADGELHVISTKRADGDARLTVIHDTLRELVTGADFAMVEDLPTHAGSAGILGMVQGVVRLLLIAEGVPYSVVPPASLKKYATGNGHAKKPQMREELRQRSGVDEPDDNKVDAAWLRIMGLDVQKAVLPFAVPSDRKLQLVHVKPKFAGV